MLSKRNASKGVTGSTATLHQMGVHKPVPVSFLFAIPTIVSAPSYVDSGGARVTSPAVAPTRVYRLYVNLPP